MVCRKGDIAPIADLYKTEVRELGKRLGVDERIINALPTDGLWDDDRKDEDQIGASYEQLEEAMEYRRGPALDILDEFNRKNKTMLWDFAVAHGQPLRI